MGQSCKLTNSFRVLGTGKWNEMNEKKKKKNPLALSFRHKSGICDIETQVLYLTTRYCSSGGKKLLDT